MVRVRVRVLDQSLALALTLTLTLTLPLTYEQMRADGLRLDTHGLLALDRLCRRHKRHELAQRARRERSMPHPDVAGGPRRRRPKPRRRHEPKFTRAWPS